MLIRIADWVKALLLAALLALAYLFLSAVARILILLVFTTIVVYMVNPFVHLLSRLIKNRTVAVILAYLAFLIIVAAAAVLAAPLIARQVDSFAAGLPDYMRTADNLIQSINTYLNKTTLGRYVRLQPRTVIEQVGKQLAAQGGAAFQLIASALEFLGQLFLVFVLSLYVLLLLPTFDRWVRRRSSADLERIYDEFAVFLDNQVSKYVRGIFALIFAIGLLTGFGLWLVGVPNAFVLGVVAGMLEVIPYFGPIVAAVPILIVAATVDWTTALLALGVVLAVQLLESNTMSPLILGKTAEINPLAVLLLLLVGGELGGVIGIFLAVPVFVIFRSVQRFIRANFTYTRSATGPDFIGLKKEA